MYKFAYKIGLLPEISADDDAKLIGPPRLHRRRRPDAMPIRRGKWGLSSRARRACGEGTVLAIP
jgi:hypothetical protein